MTNVSLNTEPWIWLGLDEQDDFSGSLADVAHYLTAQKPEEQRFYVNSAFPLTTEEAFF